MRCWAVDGAVFPRASGALLVLAHVNKGETDTALAPTLDDALDLARRKAYVILDGPPRRERAGHFRPGRAVDLGLTRASRCPP